VKNPTKHTGPILVTIMAFLCAAVFAAGKNVAASASVENWLAKKRTAISCVPGTNESKNNMPHKNEGSGCSHMGISCALFNVGNKRNKIHSC